MKRLLLLVFILALNIPLQAQRPLRHKVVLQDGTVLRGRIINPSDTDSVRIKTDDGRLYTYALHEVKEVSKTPWKERRLYPFDRSRGIFLRPELGLNYSFLYRYRLSGFIGLSTGIQFGPRYALYFGYGTRLLAGSYGWDKSYEVFIGNLFHFNNNRNSWFMDIKGSAGVNVRHIHHGDKYYSELGILSLGIGKSIGKFDVGLYSSIIWTNPNINYDELNISFSIVYNFRKPI